MFTYVSREVHHSGQRYRRCTDENPDASACEFGDSCHIINASQAYTVHVGTAMFAPATPFERWNENIQDYGDHLSSKSLGTPRARFIFIVLEKSKRNA